MSEMNLVKADGMIITSTPISNTKFEYYTILMYNHRKILTDNKIS